MYQLAWNPTCSLTLSSFLQRAFQNRNGFVPWYRTWSWLEASPSPSSVRQASWIPSSWQIYWDTGRYSSVGSGCGGQFSFCSGPNPKPCPLGVWHFFRRSQQSDLTNKAVPAHNLQRQLHFDVWISRPQNKNIPNHPKSAYTWEMTIETSWNQNEVVDSCRSWIWCSIPLPKSPFILLEQINWNRSQIRNKELSSLSTLVGRSIQCYNRLLQSSSIGTGKKTTNLRAQQVNGKKNWRALALYQKWAIDFKSWHSFHSLRLLKECEWSFWQLNLKDHY